MLNKDLPSPELLRKLLRYEPDTGKLFWRERTPDMFNYGVNCSQKRCTTWNIKYAGEEAFTKTRKGYHVGSIRNKSHAAHRVIWAMVYGKWPELLMDHVNGDRGDNRIKNLRLVTNQQNMMNAKKYNTNKSGVTGVYWNKRNKKWRAFIMQNYKEKHLGFFVNIDDAIAARKAAEIECGFHPNHGRVW